METKNRKLPKQARSRKRYDHMLTTAADLFARNGVAQVTTNHIAAEAGVSIGSVYQFFPNKEAMIEALIERYMTQFDGIFPECLDTSDPITNVIRGVVSRLVEFKESNHGFEQILVGTSNANATEEMQKLIVRKISWVLNAYYPEMGEDQRYLCAGVSFAIVAGMMPAKLPNQLMIEETVLAVNAYQQAFVERENQAKEPA
ncbi:MAG: TetR/AcrR family transcriptional regulator [Chloroflexota bacterium]